MKAKVDGDVQELESNPRVSLLFVFNQSKADW